MVWPDFLDSHRIRTDLALARVGQGADGGSIPASHHTVQRRSLKSSERLFSL